MEQGVQHACKVSWYFGIPSAYVVTSRVDIMYPRGSADLCSTFCAANTCGHVCLGASECVGHSPNYHIVACKDPSRITCESQFHYFCGDGYHWCTTAEFDANNDNFDGRTQLLSQDNINGLTKNWANNMTSNYDNIDCNDKGSTAACCADGQLIPETYSGACHSMFEILHDH